MIERVVIRGGASPRDTVRMGCQACVRLAGGTKWVKREQQLQSKIFIALILKLYETLSYQGEHTP